MEKPKILFSDLDGTLLDDRKEIEQSTKEAVQDMLAAGFYFAICTGRPLASAKQVAKQFQLDGEGCYIVAYNGGVIYDPLKDKIISYETIPYLEARKLMQKAEEAGLYAHTYDKTSDTVLTSRHLPELDFYIKTTKLPWKTDKDCVYDMEGDPPKIIVASLTSHESLKKFQEENAAWADEYMTSFFSCDPYLEYCPIGVTKGIGLKKLCDFLHIPIEASIATGDERNDIALLQMAGISAVPANAYPQVSVYANYICEKDNNQGAVGEIIRRFITG